MRSIVATTIMISLAAPAVAQRTDCSTNAYGQTTCVTRQPEQNGTAELGTAIGTMLGNRSRQRAQEAQFSDNALATARRRAAGEMIDAGQCDAARSMALKAGDLDLAAQIKAAC